MSEDRMNGGACCGCGQKPRKRFNIFKAALQLAALYVVLVFGSGTMIQTGNPVATELGKLIQVVTFVHPTIHWAHSSGHPKIASGLETLSHGLDIS